MAEIARVSPQEAREKMKAGTAIMVCAYASEEKFATFQLDGAISLQSFTEMVSNLPSDQEIIFY